LRAEVDQVDVRARLRPVIITAAERGQALARRHNWLPEAPVPQPLGGGIPGAGKPVLNEHGLAGIDAVLHTLRGVELSRMPQVEGTMLSAGCAGSLYFRWIESSYGPVKRHIGVEFYNPRPDDLPPGVEWVKSTVADMQGVEDSSVELVYSGQNFEHLFGDDAVGFLLESRRVLQPDGWLVIDSPNREITAALTWTMPEHTIEFTPSEAADLATLAGFDVTSIRGLWLCREPATGEVYPRWSEDGSPLPAEEVARRAAMASFHPDDSFIWWLEARRADRKPDVAALRARHAEIFAQAWPERCNRLLSAVGERSREDGREIVSVPAGIPGCPLFGPYMPFSPGHYRATFTLRRRGKAASRGRLAVLDIADGQGNVLAQHPLRAGDLRQGEWTRASIECDVTELTWGGQFRVNCTGAAAIDVIVGVQVEETGTSVAPSALGDSAG
jgi:SAM-dependent methyltransferase